MTRPSRPLTAYSIGRWVASTIRARSRSETSITRQTVGRPGTASGVTYTVRQVTVPRQCTSCSTRAGTHTARWGGTTKLAWSVITVMTPVVE